MLLFKLNPDRDLYMQWSMIADGPGRVKPREYWIEEIREAQKREHYGFVPLPDFTAEAALDRADQYGTTAKDDAEGRYPRTGGWDDNGVVVNGCAWLPRKNFERFADAYLALPWGPLPIQQLVADGILEVDNNDEGATL